MDLHLWNRGKSLKIPKGRSETLNRRETYNTMTNRKGQTMIHKTLHRKLNWNTNPIKNREWSHVLLNGKQFLLLVSSFCSACDTRRVILVTRWQVINSDYDYDKQNISVVICDTDIALRLACHCGNRKLSKWSQNDRGWTHVLAMGKQFLFLILTDTRHVSHMFKTSWPPLYTQTNTNNIRVGHLYIHKQT